MENAKVVLQALIGEALEDGPVKMDHLASQLEVIASELRDYAQTKRERMIAQQPPADTAPRSWRQGRA